MPLGAQIYTWVNRFARKIAAKPDASGIMTISNKDAIRDLSNEILTKFMKYNVPKSALKSENDVKVIYNQIREIENQVFTKNLKKALKSKKSAEVVDLTGKKIDTSKGIMGGFEVGAKTKTPSPFKKETEAQVKSRLEGMNKKTVERIKRRRFEAAQKAERKKMAEDPEYIPEILDPDDFAYGGLAGMLGERTGYKTGLKVYPDPIMRGGSGVKADKADKIDKFFKVYPQASARIGEADIENLPPEITPETKDITYGGTLMGGFGDDGFYGGIEGLKIKNKIDYVLDNQTLFKDTTDDEKINFILGKKSDDHDLRLKIDKELKNARLSYEGKYGKIGLQTDTDLENPELSWTWKFAGGGLAPLLGEPTYADGGRIGFKGKKFDPKRRGFLKLAAGLATIPFISKFFKWAKPLAKTVDLTSVPIKSGVDGMPVWFKPLVNKVIKEGDDVTKKFATVDREIVHTKKLGKGEFADEVTVYQDLNNGNVRVEYHASGNMGEAPIQLDYKAGHVIEYGPKKGTKSKPEFSAVESEPEVVNWDGDIEWTGENVVNKVDDLLTDTTKLETYATGKNPNIKKLLKSPNYENAHQYLLQLMCLYKHFCHLLKV